MKRKNFTGKQISRNEQGAILVYNLSQYRGLLEDGYDTFDFSKINLKGEDIQSIDLSNLGLEINLQEIFFPFNGSSKHYNNILCPVFSHGDSFVYLNESNLKGNNVVGELSNAIERERGVFGGYRTCTFIYSDETFDDEYKKEHPEYFLSGDAPSELREIYYKPLLRKELVSILFDFDEKKEITVRYRQVLTFDMFLNYYAFLHGKYLERFRISPLDLGKIKLVEALGLEQTKQTIKSFSDLNIDPNLVFTSISIMTLEQIRAYIFCNNKFIAEEILLKLQNTIEEQQKVLK